MKKETARQYVERIFNEARTEAREKKETQLLFNFASSVISPTRKETEAEYVKRTGRF